MQLLNKHRFYEFIKRKNKTDTFKVNLQYIIYLSSKRKKLRYLFNKLYK